MICFLFINKIKKVSYHERPVVGAATAFLFISCWGEEVLCMYACMYVVMIATTTTTNKRELNLALECARKKNVLQYRA